MLAIVFFSIIFGIALNKTNHLTGNFSNAFERLNTVFMQLVIMIMTFAPIGVFWLIGRFVIADGLDIFQDVFDKEYKIEFYNIINDLFLFFNIIFKNILRNLIREVRFKE